MKVSVVCSMALEQSLEQNTFKTDEFILNNFHIQTTIKNNNKQRPNKLKQEKGKRKNGGLVLCFECFE